MHVGMVYVGTVVNLLSIEIYISQNHGLKNDSLMMTLF